MRKFLSLLLAVLMIASLSGIACRSQHRGVNWNACRATLSSLSAVSSKGLPAIRFA